MGVIKAYYILQQTLPLCAIEFIRIVANSIWGIEFKKGRYVATSCGGFHEG